MGRQTPMYFGLALPMLLPDNSLAFNTYAFTPAGKAGRSVFLSNVEMREKSKSAVFET